MKMAECATGEGAPPIAAGSGLAAARALKMAKEHMHYVTAMGGKDDQSLSDSDDSCYQYLTRDRFSYSSSHSGEDSEDYTECIQRANAVKNQKGTLDRSRIVEKEKSTRATEEHDLQGRRLYNTVDMQRMMRQKDLKISLLQESINELQAKLQVHQKEMKPIRKGRKRETVFWICSNAFCQRFNKISISKCGSCGKPRCFS